MGMAAILFDNVEPFEQIGYTLLTEAPCEIWWKLQFIRRNEKITQFYRCIFPRGKGR